MMPGNYTIVLRGQSQPTNPKDNANKKVVGPPNLIEHSIPIEIAIVPKQIFKFKNSDNSIKVSRGTSVDVAVALTRLFPYDGAAQVEIVTPAKGIEAKVSPLGGTDEELKLKLQVAADAPLGPVILALRVTAQFNETPVVHDATVRFNIK